MTDGLWLVLLWLACVTVSVTLVLLAVARNRRTVQRKKAALQASFDALSFDTPAGRVHGDALTVAKIAYQPGNEVPHYAARGAAHWDAFWYAVGPGPSYFLAICMVDTHAREAPPQWVVRPIDEARMHAALAGDALAERLAFGGAIKA